MLLVKDPPKLQLLSLNNCQSYLVSECNSSLNEYIALEEMENINQLENREYWELINRSCCCYNRDAQLANPPLYTIHGNPVRCLLLSLPEDLHHLSDGTLKDLLLPSCEVEDIRIYIPYALVTVRSHKQATQ